MAEAKRASTVSSWRQFKAILRKDIVMELRTFEMLTSMGLYTLLTLVIYQIALSQSGSGFDVRLIAAGLLWLAFVFTSMLGLNRSLVHEKDQGCLEALLLSPVDRPVIFFAKATGNLIFLLIVQTLTIPLFYLMDRFAHRAYERRLARAQCDQIAAADFAFHVESEPFEKAFHWAVERCFPNAGYWLWGWLMQHEWIPA